MGEKKINEHSPFYTSFVHDRMQETCTIIKVIRKVRKRWQRNPLFGMRFQTTGKKRVHWASTGHETQFSNKFGAKLSSPCPFFS
jgi:hypothetical protein